MSGSEVLSSELKVILDYNNVMYTNMDLDYRYDDPEDTNRFYFRSDHFNFAKAGVPALYAKGGDDLVDGGMEAGQAAQADYRDKRYHQVGDEFDESWNLEGAVQDLQALYGVGQALAGSEQWPHWYQGNAFRAAEQKLRAAAK